MLISEREMLLERWNFFEKAYIMRSPALECEFAHDERTQLSLYDSVIPKLREHNKLRIRPELRSDKDYI